MSSPLSRLAVASACLMLGACASPVAGPLPASLAMLEKSCLPTLPRLPPVATLAPHPVIATVRAPEPAGMDRIEITQSDGMAFLRRVPAAAALPQLQQVRLEILNGNGRPGMAGTLARSLVGSAVRVTRIGNAPSFQVARTRLQYRPAQAQAARQMARQLGPAIDVVPADCPNSELRLILGRDFDPAMLHRYYLLQLQLARQALARLG
ncbi:LytR C-terminal domain-containing protein [Janthinobacterium sp. RB2R34]|uniref:LytR C-terminal domain-containing protein n=1 Tax=Janthinobacterium sp. RB2R34 TaxID=3424193 RepID=UPI003F25F547